MTYIYYKESTKNFPPLGHPLIPPLFIEAGRMPTHIPEKTKACIILVNLAGIYFLRPVKLQKTYKISKFLSSFSINEIIYDEKKRTILTKRDSVYLQSPHMDDAIMQLVASRKFLFQKLYEKNPIKFTNYPTPPNIVMNTPMNASLLTLQYVCYCIENGAVPDDNGIIPIFEKFDPQHQSIIAFDDDCQAPTYINCLSGPIHLLEPLTTLHFKNFAPYAACRIIHKIMRHNYRIRTFIIDGYQHLVPEQLRLKKLNQRGLISIVIQNCRIPEDTMIRLFNELAEYQGEVQRLTLKNIEFTDKSWKALLNTITTCRAFRTIEILELDNIDAPQLLEDQLNIDLLTISKHLRFIQRFSVSLWSQPQLYTSIEPFFVNSLLFELVLKGQNFTQPFPESLKLPRCIHCLDFSECNFTYISLKSLFAFLSRTPEHIPITLNLADIMLPTSQWHQFYSDLSIVNHTTFISELNWSGNVIDPNFINETVSFFFTMNPIKFISIDRIFGDNKIEDFYTFCEAIPHGKLRGMSIGGSIEQNFSGNFELLFKGIAATSPLNILHLVGQKMQPEDIQPLYKFLADNKSLCEFYIDDTNIPSGLKFCEFYDHIFNLNIPVIGRPEIDLDRVFGPKTFGELNNKDAFYKFQEKITKLPSAATRNARAFYFSRNDFQKDFQPNQYITFIQRYPTSFFNPDYTDPFNLQFRSSKSPIPSLLILGRSKLIVRSLSELHSACLAEPTKAPYYAVPPKLNNEVTAETGFNDYDSLNNYKAMNQLSTFGAQLMPPTDDSNFTAQNNQPESNNQNQQADQEYDQQFNPDPDYFNQNQQFIPDPQLLSQNFDDQFIPDPYFFQNNPDQQFQQLEPQLPLEPLDQLPPQQPLQPLDELPPQQPLQQTQKSSDFDNNFMPSPNYDEQFMPSPEFIAHNQFQSDPQYVSDQSYQSQSSSEFIPNPIHTSQNHQQAPPPPLHDSGSGNIDIKHPDIFFHANHQKQEEKQKQETEKEHHDKQKTSSIFIPPPFIPPPLSETTTTEQNNVQNKEIPPQLSPIPPNLLSSQKDQENQAPGPLLPPNLLPSQKDQDNQIPPPLLSSLNNQENQIPAPAPAPLLQPIPPNLLPSKDHDNQIPAPLKLPNIPSPLKASHNPNIPPPLNANAPNLIRSSMNPAQPPPLIPSNLTKNPPSFVPDHQSDSESIQKVTKPQEKQKKEDPEIPDPAKKDPGFVYAPNEPRRGPPVLLEKLQFMTKKKSKKNKFESCAGLIDIPRPPAISKNPIKPAERSVKIPDVGLVPIPDSTTIETAQPPQDLSSFEDIEIQDLVTLKSITFSEKKVEYKVFDHQYENDVKSFYESAGEGLPFELLKATPSSMIEASEMSHPLQRRKRIEFPHVTFLGVPTEW